MAKGVVEATKFDEQTHEDKASDTATVGGDVASVRDAQGGGRRGSGEDVGTSRSGKGGQKGGRKVGQRTRTEEKDGVLKQKYDAEDGR